MHQIMGRLFLNRKLLEDVVTQGLLGNPVPSDEQCHYVVPHGSGNQTARFRARASRMPAGMGVRGRSPPGGVWGSHPQKT
jgi:hypothetical protein